MRTKSRTELEPGRGTYQRTHPWIKFFLDLRETPYQVWLRLGAIQSKCEHVANAMLPPSAAKDLYRLFLAKGVSATTAIEGNTLTEEEVRQIIAKKTKVFPSKEYHVVEVKNILHACAVIGNDILEGADCKITTDRIKYFNRLILESLPVDEGVVPGKVSPHQVVVAAYRGAPRAECEYLMDRMCTWLDGLRSNNEEERIPIAVMRAVMAHLYLAWIHPFGDGNGRTARLIEYQILLGAGVPAISAHLLSNHYNQTRNEYYRQLDRASKSGGDVWPFIAYAVKGMVDGMTSQLQVIRKHQWNIAWKDFVYETFRGKTSATAHRQRELALRLPRFRGVSIHKIPLLSPDLARLYANRTSKTVTRDVTALHDMGLVTKTRHGDFRANRSQLQYFLPRRRKESARQ